MKKTAFCAFIISVVCAASVFAQTFTLSNNTLGSADFSSRTPMVSPLASQSEANAAAQDFVLNEGWEVYGGYGFFSLNSIAMMLANALGLIFTAPASAITDQETDFDYKDSGVFNLGADYYFGEHLFAGVTATFQYFHALATDVLFSSIMAEGGVQYGWSRFKFYQTLALGAGFAAIGSHGTSGFFAFNVTMLGMKARVTNGSWIYFESNAGQKAFIQLGARFRM